MSEPLVCDALSVRFGSTVALEGASLDVRPGEVMALLGPSGCGKTTLLRCVAGFQRADSGTVRLGGRLLDGAGTHVAPHRRSVGLVFQEHALFPHLTVAANVGFGLPRGAAGKQRVAELLAMGGLEGMARRYPHQLSGGQQQRAALLRSLAPRPTLLLLDEPFSNLDAALRASLRAQVAGLLRAEGVTAVLVTHDRADAFAVADRVAVMFEGRVEQTAPPDEVYLRPRSPAAAAITGEVQFVEGVARGEVVETPLGILRCSGPATSGPAHVLLRPEWIVPDEHGIEATIEPAHLEGSDWRAGATIRPGLRLMLSSEGGRPLPVGAARIGVSIAVPAFAPRPADDPAVV